MKAQDVITDALERCNKLSPGETPDADLMAFCLRKLNTLVDEMSAQNCYLYQKTLTSAATTGQITLGSGAWAAFGPGDLIVSMTADNFTMAPITMQQYNELYQPTLTGLPQLWAQDGMNAVYLWPIPTGQTIKIEVRGGVAPFADYATDYPAPNGYQNAMGAGLAVRIAPVLLGGVTPALLAAEKRAMGAVEFYEPRIIDAYSYTGYRWTMPPRLFN